MSSFFETVDRARDLLRTRGRVTLRALRRELSLDEETVEDVAEELVEAQRVAARDGGALAWAGERTDNAASAPVVLVPNPTAPSAAARGAGAAATAPSSADSAAPPPTPEVRGERRQLTVMLCDIAGSTELSQRMDPEDLSALVSQFRELCAKAFKRFDGDVAHRRWNFPGR